MNREATEVEYREMARHLAECPTCCLTLLISSTLGISEIQGSRVVDGQQEAFIYRVPRLLAARESQSEGRSRIPAVPSRGVH